MLPTPRRNLLTVVLLAASLTACAGGDGREKDEIEELGRIHDLHLAEFRARQERFLAENPMPMRREVPGIGTLIVHEANLGGRLGQETLRVLFTWVNSTGGTTNGALVRIRLRDPRTGVEREQRVELRSLLGAGFIQDCTYTSFVDLPTDGVHLQPGWDWGIELEALVPNLWPAETVPAAR